MQMFWIFGMKASCKNVTNLCAIRVRQCFATYTRAMFTEVVCASLTRRSSLVLFLSLWNIQAYEAKEINIKGISHPFVVFL